MCSLTSIAEQHHSVRTTRMDGVSIKNSDETFAALIEKGVTQEELYEAVGGEAEEVHDLFQSSVTPCFLPEELCEGTGGGRSSTTLNPSSVSPSSCWGSSMRWQCCSQGLHGSKQLVFSFFLAKELHEAVSGRAFLGTLFARPHYRGLYEAWEGNLLPA